MSRNEVVSLVMLATAAYPSAQEKDPDPVVKAWYLMLKDIPFALAKAALVRVCRTSQFFPTIVSIVEAADELDPQAEKLPTAAQAWGEVSQLIQSVGPYRAPVYSCELVRKAAQSIGWRQLCMGENPETDRAHFLRIYESMRNQKQQNRENEKALELSGMAEVLKALTAGWKK